MHKGSLQFWQRRRARGRLPRARSAPKIKAAMPSNIVAYKVGMAHLGMVDDSDAPSKNTEISVPCTILEVPKQEIYGARFYKLDGGYRKVMLELYSSEAAKRLKYNKIKNTESRISEMEKGKAEIEDITVLVAAYPRGMPVEQHHPMKYEAHLGGSIDDKLGFVKEHLGKELKASDVVKSGEYVNVSTVTKGKGWQGTIKRFGTARLYHKATNKVRHVGTLGPFTPGKVLYTVPQAGQLGFNYRTETNKRILKIGGPSDGINPKSGFANYGVVSNDYIIIKGSIGGPSKRLVRIRKSMRGESAVKEPKINYISLLS